MCGLVSYVLNVVLLACLNNTKKSLKIPRGNQKPFIADGQAIQWPEQKGQTMIYLALHRKLKIAQHEFYSKPGFISRSPGGLALPVPQVTPMCFWHRTLSDIEIVLNTSMPVSSHYI